MNSFLWKGRSKHYITEENLAFEEITKLSAFNKVEFVQEHIFKHKCIWLFRPKARTAASIILRGANDFMCDEMERSVHDALCVVKRVLESKSVVPGGGAVEAALSIYLENFATSLVRFTCEVLVNF